MFGTFRAFYECGFVVMNLFENDAVARLGVIVSTLRSSEASETGESHHSFWSHLNGMGHRKRGLAPSRSQTLRQSIFVISSNLRSAHALRSALQNVGYDVMVSCSFNDAIAAIELPPDFVGALICFDRPDAETLQRLDECGSDIPLLVMSNALPASDPAEIRFHPIFPDAAVCVSTLLELGLYPASNRGPEHRLDTPVPRFLSDQGDGQP